MLPKRSVPRVFGASAGVSAGTSAGTSIAASAGTSEGAVLALIRAGAVSTRADVVRMTGLARSTVAQRLDTLIDAGLVTECRDTASTGGRPPARIAFNAQGGLLLAAALGATHCRLAVTDLEARPLGEIAADMAITRGPDAVLDWVAKRFLELLRQIGRAPADVCGIGIGVPGPVEFAAGRVVSPPIMPGWDGVPIPERLQAHFPVPVLVDNDVNVMALGEYWAHYRNLVEDLLFVKVGTGIGCGIVAGGCIHRGAQGTAGDIGHNLVPEHRDAVCHCGNQGCIEAVASGSALARRLTELGITARGSREVVDLVRSGNPEAIRLVRSAGKLLGQVLAGVVNFFNPAAIVIGGDMAQAHEHLFAGVREVVYRRSTALATMHLQIVQSRLGDRAGVQGAAIIALEHVLSPNYVDQRIATGKRLAEARP